MEMAGSEPRRRVLPLVRIASEPGARSLDQDALDAWSAIAAPVAVFDIDDAGALRWGAANPAQRDALCADFETLRGRRVEAFGAGPLSQWVFEHRETLAALTERAVFEPEHPDSDTGRWTAHTVTPVRDAQGGTRRLVITSADVTERNRLAAMVSHAARTDALGRVAGEAAHEFNNLMVAISGYAGLALRTLAPDDRAHAQLVEVLRLSDEASSRSRQLMALARRHEGARSPLRLDALVASLAKAIQCVLRDDVAVTAAPASELWTVKADSHQLEQALLHLALFGRATVPRGETLTFATENVTLSRDEARGYGLSAGEYVSLTMRGGATVTAPTRAFEPQPSVLRTDAGADLATCRGVALRHGGAFAVSDDGKGVDARMLLPRAVEKSAVSGVSMATARLHGTEALLVVDPGPSREPSARALRMLGYEVLEASQVDDALRIVAEREAAPIHLVVLGVGPAQPSVAALLRAVRARDGDVPVLVTAPDETSIMPIALVSARVVKLPASLAPTMLVRRVRECLDERARGA